MTFELPSLWMTQACCYTDCNIVFALPVEFDKARRKDHAWFYCPNGHRQHYTGKTDEQKRIAELEAQLGQTQRSRDAAREQLDRTQRERDHANRSLTATKGHLTRIRNRIANGVCPVPGCKRSGLGPDVVAHITTCHPEFTKHQDHE